MSYSTIHTCANDPAFTNRVTACCAQEGQQQPALSMAWVVWGVATASDIEAAYASALAAENPNPGGDESVVTDAMILGNVQRELTENPPPDSNAGP